MFVDRAYYAYYRFVRNCVFIYINRGERFPRMSEKGEGGRISTDFSMLETITACIFERRKKLSLVGIVLSGGYIQIRGSLVLKFSSSGWIWIFKKPSKRAEYQDIDIKDKSCGINKGVYIFEIQIYFLLFFFFFKAFKSSNECIFWRRMGL